MTEIPTKKADLTKSKNQELIAHLKTEIEKDDYISGDRCFLTTAKEKIQEIEGNYSNDNLIYPLIEIIEKINYKIETYKLSDTFSILNKEDYSIIRNGFITIGGEASAGKTSFLNALSIDILKENPDTCFLFYSLDDSLPLSGKRILSQLNNENLFRKDIDKSIHAKGENENLLNRIVIMDNLNINNIDRQAKAVKRLTDCKKIIIGIDYLQIISNTGTGTQQTFDKRDYLNNTLKQLKEYQKVLEKEGGCIVFLLSQLNRNTKSDTFRYRDTSEIENQSDVCIDLSQEKDNETKKLTAIINKNKLGLRGMKLETEINECFNFSKFKYSNNEIVTKVKKSTKTQITNSYIGEDLR